MSPLLTAIAGLLEMIASDATDGLIAAAESVEQNLFNVFLDHGMSVDTARQWAKLITKELLA